MALPQNAQAIYSYLVGQGLTPNAAAGVLGNMERESGGNPESVGTGGNGLIGWTPPLGGAVTGNVAKDLQFQLAHVITYIKSNGSIQDLNSNASSPTAAAIHFMSKYERPGIPAQAQRVQAAVDVANAAKSGNWKGSSSPNAPPSSGGGGGILSIPQDITNAFIEADKWITKLGWILTPSHWVRIAAFFIGMVLLMFAVRAFIAVGEGSPILPKVNVAPVPVIP